MARRLVILATIAAVLLSLGPLVVIAQDSKKPSDPAAQAAGATSQSATKAVTPKLVGPANSVVICRCGRVFTPTATTESFTFEGKQYMTCSDACYKIAMSDPTKAAKDSEENKSKLLAMHSQPTTATTSDSKTY